MGAAPFSNLDDFRLHVTPLGLRHCGDLGGGAFPGWVQVAGLLGCWRGCQGAWWRRLVSSLWPVLGVPEVDQALVWRWVRASPIFPASRGCAGQPSPGACPRSRLRGHRPERAVSGVRVMVAPSAPADVLDPSPLGPCRCRGSAADSWWPALSRSCVFCDSCDRSMAPAQGARRRVCEILESLGSYVGVTLQGLEVRCETVATKARDTDESAVLFGLWSTMRTLLAR
jgi:hypothetical protein